MTRRPPRSTLTSTLFPSTTLFHSDVDRLFQPVVHLPAAAVPDRLSAAAGVLLRRAQPDLPILDSHRRDRADTALVRGGAAHPVASPRPTIAIGRASGRERV